MTVMTVEQSDLQEKILNQIAAKHWSNAEETLLEVLDGTPPPPRFHAPVIQKLARRKLDRLRALYEPFLEREIEQGRGTDVQTIVEMVLAEDETQAWLRPILLSAIRSANADRQAGQVEDFITRAKLDDESVSLRKGLQQFDDLLGATVGQIFRHHTWGLGIVKELDLANGSVLLDFQTRKAQKMTLQGVRDFLERIPKDHIEARAAVDPEGLKASAKKDPGEVIRTTLRSFNGKIKVADMKRLFTRTFMTENDYKSFWNDARSAIKLDPWVEQRGQGQHAELLLRSKPQSFLEETIKLLDGAKTAEARYEVLRDVQKHGGDTEVTPEDTARLQALYLKPLNDNSIVLPWQKLAHGLLFEEFSDLFGDLKNPIDVDALLQRDDVRLMLRHVCVHDLRRIALQQVLDTRKDSWQEIFAEMMPEVDTRTAAWMERELAKVEGRHFHSVAIENVFARPSENPELFAWAARSLMYGSWPELSESLPPVMVCEEILSLLAELQERTSSSDAKAAAEARNQVAKVRGLLNENNNIFVKKAVIGSTLEEARRMLRTVKLHDALPAPLKASMENVFINQHKDLRQTSRGEEEEERRKPSYHYTTNESLDKQRQLLSQLKQDTKNMASVIETAREMGDLKENAEYHAAKDRQKLLMQQAAELEDLIARARVVEVRADEAMDVSRFGARITIRNVATGESRTYTVMGMWEGDLEKNIISYLTPFGSQLLNRRVGETFVVVLADASKTEYEVTALENTLT